MNMITTTYTVPEFEEIQSEQKHPFLGLFNLDESQIVPFNSYSTDPGEKLKEIKRALNSPALTDGVYVIKTKSSHSKKATSFEYPILKGSPENINLNNLNEAAEQPAKGFEPNVTSYSNVLELNIELERLKMKCEQQEKLIEELESALEAYEESENENNELLNEKPSDLKTFFESLVPLVAPILDKHNEIREKRLNLDAARFQFMSEQQRTRTQPAQEQKGSEDNAPNMDGVKHTDTRIKAWINQFKADPAKYEQLAEIYNQAQTLDDFFTECENTCTPDEYENLISFIND